MTRRNRDILILACIGIALVILVSIQGAKYINLAPVFTLVLYAGLIAVTMFYVYYSMEIARATREQAEASVEMAEEMREQRYTESLPLLAPTIPPPLSGLAPNEIPYESLQSGVGIKVIWCNVGKGVAINSRFSFWAAPTSPGKASFFPPRESGTLEVEGEKEVDYSKILDDGQLTAISDAYQPRLEAEYQDIYEREVTTVQEFRIDEQNKRAFLGELYFTVNGRRLGG